MTVNTEAVLLGVWIPLFVLWIIVLVDIVRQPRMSTRAKALWALACTLVWPALVVYLLIRPTRGRLEVQELRTDPQARLVDAVLDHEAGRIDDAQMAAAVSTLRARGSGAPEIEG